MRTCPAKGGKEIGLSGLPDPNRCMSLKTYYQQYYLSSLRQQHFEL